MHLAPPPSNAAIVVADPIVRIINLSKVDACGFKALDAINLEGRPTPRQERGGDHGRAGRCST